MCFEMSFKNVSFIESLYEFEKLTEMDESFSRLNKEYQKPFENLKSVGKTPEFSFNILMSANVKNCICEFEKFFNNFKNMKLTFRNEFEENQFYFILIAVFGALIDEEAEIDRPDLLMEPTEELIRNAKESYEKEKPIGNIFIHPEKDFQNRLEYVVDVTLENGEKSISSIEFEKLN